MKRLCCWIVLVVCAPQAPAQSYPARPVRIVVPYSAGGGTDIVGNTPAEFAAFISAESVKYAKIIKQAGVKLD